MKSHDDHGRTDVLGRADELSSLLENQR